MIRSCLGAAWLQLSACTDATEPNPASRAELLAISPALTATTGTHAGNAVYQARKESGASAYDATNNTTYITYNGSRHGHLRPRLQQHGVGVELAEAGETLYPALTVPMIGTPTPDRVSFLQIVTTQALHGRLERLRAVLPLNPGAGSAAVHGGHPA